MLTIIVIVLSGLATLVKHWPFRRAVSPHAAGGDHGTIETPSHPVAA
jgi:hypothetical protein